MTDEDPSVEAQLDVDAIVRVWAERGSQLDESSRRAVVATLHHQLSRFSDPAAPWIEALYAFDPSLVIPIEDIRQLRGVLHDHIVVGRPAEEAIVLEHRLGILLDQLIADAAQRRIAAVEETALVDPLTGLWNRRAASQVFDATLAHARRHDRPVAVAVADLVGLKRINDSEGHAAGDDALRRFARAISMNLRRGDAAFRFGGDEFVVIAADTTAESLAMVFERLRDDAPEFSVGIAQSPDDGADAAALLAVADKRLYDVRRGATPRRRARLSRVQAGLLALSTAAAAILLVEVGREVADIHLSEGPRAAWFALLAAIPLVAAGGTSLGPVRGARASLRRGVNLTGMALVSAVALVALLTPILSVDDGTDGSQVAGPRNQGELPFDEHPPATAPDVPPPTVTTTTTLPPSVGSPQPATAPTRVRRTTIPTVPIASKPPATPPAVPPPTITPPTPTPPDIEPPAGEPVVKPKPPVTSPPTYGPASTHTCASKGHHYGWARRPHDRTPPCGRRFPRH